MAEGTGDAENVAFSSQDGVCDESASTSSSGRSSDISRASSSVSSDEAFLVSSESSESSESEYPLPPSHVDSHDHDQLQTPAQDALPPVLPLPSIASGTATSVISIESSDYPTYKIVGDNIDKFVRPRFMQYDSQSRSLHFFNHCAVKDRIDIHDLSDIPPS